MIDFSNIKEDFIKVLEHSQGVLNPKVDEVWNNWLTNKLWIYQAMGNKLIWESEEELTFELEDYERVKKFEDFCNYIYDRYRNEALSNYIYYMKDKVTGDNIVPEDYTMETGQVIKQGMKFSKSFKFFIENPVVLEDVQNYVSRIFQEGKIKGKLCISIHPLDFLSISENTYNWRSCHALDGEYRSGNLSYMQDKNTFICYLKGKDDAVLPRFPEDVSWNNKKWRVLMFLSDDNNMIMAGRQYPFGSFYGIDYILKSALYDCGIFDYKNQWTNWSNKRIKKMKFGDGREVCFHDSYLPVGNDLKCITDLVVDKPSATHFNDLTNSSVYTPYYAYKECRYWYSPTGESNKNTKFFIGHSVPCIACGNNLTYLGADCMLCSECAKGYDEDHYYCERCGTRLDNDCYYVVDGDPLCDHCVEEYAGRCEVCDELHYYADMHYNEKDNTYICEWCKGKDDN